MMKRFKAWLIQTFLPTWAKNTLLEENEKLKVQLTAVRKTNSELQSYIDGMERALRLCSKGLEIGGKDTNGIYKKPI